MGRINSSPHEQLIVYCTKLWCDRGENFKGLKRNIKTQGSHAVCSQMSAQRYWSQQLVAVKNENE